MHALADILGRDINFDVQVHDAPRPLRLVIGSCRWWGRVVRQYRRLRYRGLFPTGSRPGFLQAQKILHPRVLAVGGKDRVLRLLVVTPDMHRVHHSVIIRETNSNYGFNLSWWDRLLGTYKAQPAKGHTDMVIGLSQFRDPQKLSLTRLLILPFVGDPGRVPINRH